MLFLLLLTLLLLNKSKDTYLADYMNYKNCSCNKIPNQL